VRTKSKGEAVSPDAARDSGNGVRSSRPGLEKRYTQSLKRESSFWSSAARRKEADRVGSENQIQKRKKGDDVRSLPVRTQRPFLHESPIKRLSVP
jgi:hypothetical protein